MSEDPPYQRIAADLRQRIRAGELVAGDRLPSVRALAADRGVATATAAKALEELRRSGEACTQARVGTVVAAPSRPAPRSRTGTSPGRAEDTSAAGRRRRSAPDTALTRDRVVSAALAIADQEGLEVLSMRTVAARLDTPTMTLYRHVRSKEALVWQMADAAYGEAPVPEPGGLSWRAQLEGSARTLWRLYRKHPWLAQLGSLARPLALPNLLRHGEGTLAALASTGLSAARALDLQILLYSYGQGLAANREREVQAQVETGLSDAEWGDAQLPALQALADSGRYPHFAWMLAGLSAGYDFDLDALFETGLRSLLDGFERIVAEETALPSA